MRWMLVGLLALASPALAADAGLVVACDSLVSLRLLTAAAPDRSTALARVAEQPGCRVTPRADIGVVEHRAMIGGVPFECLAVRAEAQCLWVQP
ncbi:hypothetical protein [uncultured Methylobacterium sp.]|uniref:hypothetical protein n=1 Tax=uncultured Methylobacterium sp. TaxID=157278 RepID=UPI0035CAF328